MSGQQIGTAVGFVAGFFLPGGPQVWAAIGGAIGGWISPTQVNGPHIGDGQAQSSAEGIPIAWILGTAGWVQGQIVQKSVRREVKKTDDGKGSGTEVNTFEAHQDYCILICESSETRDSLMVGVLIVRVDGKIVYDMRPEKDFAAENAKFLGNHTFYDGNESQLSDPTMEAITGVGNTPYNRGVYTMVARDVNLSQYGERIPTYEFVMVGEGDNVSTEVTTLVAPQYSGFIDSHWPLRDAEDKYTYSGTRDIETFTADSIQEILEHFGDFYGPYRAVDFYLGYSFSNPGGESFDVIEPQESVVNNESVVLLYSDLTPEHYVNAAASAGCSIATYPGPFGVSELYADRVGIVFFMEADDSPDDWPGYTFFNNCISLPLTGPTYPQVFGSYPVYITVTRTKFVPDPVAGDPCLLGVPVLLPDVPGFVTDCAGNIFPIPTYAPATGIDVWVLQQEGIDKLLLGPVLPQGDPDNTEAFWTAAYDAEVLAGRMDAGLAWDDDYPVLVAASQVFTATSTVESMSTDTLNLSTAITRICKRGGLTEADIDVSEMDQQLLGYPIKESYNGADCLRPLMTGFTCYGSEYDAQLHFHKHGEEIEIVIDPDDFIIGSETDKDTREQKIEYPRLLSVTAIDPTQDYTPRPQIERRTTPDVRAIGEESMQVPIVMTPDSQRQLAAIGMKVAWARAQGSREFSVPYAGFGVYLRLVAGKPFALEGKRRIAAEIGFEDGEIKINGLYDRQSAYTSDVTATPALPPTPPPSSIGGVTIFSALNIGVLRDQDDRVGLYLAVAGILPAWPGCLLQWSIDDGASWSTAISSMTQSSTMGYLTEPLPLAPATGDDVTNTLSVAVHGGQLNSITRTQYLNETNPYAIVRDPTTGQCEIGQFQFATETTPDAYDLTTLVRGGLNSTPASHPTAARFVFLDSVYFLEVPSAWIGRTILFRPVTFGTVAESNATYEVMFTPAVSQTEWPPGALVGERNGSDDFTATVYPRHRLGNDLTPIASTNFTGFSWRFEVGGIVVTASTDPTTTSYTLTAAMQTTFWGAPQPEINVSVAETNRITGAGPTLSETL